MSEEVKSSRGRKAGRYSLLGMKSDISNWIRGGELPDKYQVTPRVYGENSKIVTFEVVTSEPFTRSNADGNVDVVQFTTDGTHRHNVKEVILSTWHYDGKRMVKVKAETPQAENQAE